MSPRNDERVVSNKAVFCCVVLALLLTVLFKNSFSTAVSSQMTCNVDESPVSGAIAIHLKYTTHDFKCFTKMYTQP